MDRSKTLYFPQLVVWGIIKVRTVHAIKITSYFLSKPYILCLPNFIVVKKNISVLKESEFSDTVISLAFD